MSSTALRRIDAADEALATTAPGDFTREQVDLIKRTVADGTSDDELALFLEVCRSTGLNPFQKQIYAIMREVWNPRTRQREPRMTIQTGIDGYRLIAARTGQHVGTSDIEYGPVETDGPAWARVTVYRSVAGERAAFTATARWEEYAQRKRGQNGQPGDLTEMWARMGHTMLGKCAESLALRRAFPAELSGVYTREEMAQATVEEAEVVETPGPIQSAPVAPRKALPEASGAPVGVVETEADAVDPDALMETLNLRLDSLHGASEETLNAWYTEARRDWPTGPAGRIMDAIRKEAARRKEAA